MPTLRYLRQDRRKAESTWLATRAANVTSQSGEDGVIAAIFERIGKKSGWCVEFGAWDGLHFSNTFSLIEQGWSSVQIEGSRARFRELEARHADNPRVHCVNARVGWEPGVDALDDVLGATPLPRVFDLLSIDVDGADYWVWHSLRRYRPRVVVIEINQCIPAEVVFIQDKDFSVHQGSSLLAVCQLAKGKTYELAAVIGCNAVLVAAEDFPALGIADNSLDAMFFPSRDARLFPTYDGTLYNVGLNAVRPWSSSMQARAVGPTDIQVLTPEERVFGDALVPETDGDDA